jgi:hypothetical protein
MTARVQLFGITAAFALLNLSCVDPRVFAPSDGYITVHITGQPADPGLRLTVFLRDRVAPFNVLRTAIAIGDSMRIGDLGIGYEVDVGLEDLGTYSCKVNVLTSREAPLFGATMTTVTVSAIAPPVVKFDVTCKSGTVEITTVGLPPNDSVWIRAVWGDSSLAANPINRSSYRIANGFTRLAVTPHPSFWILPDSLVAANGRLYKALPHGFSLASRAVQQVTLQFQPSHTCLADRPVAWYRLDGNALDAGPGGVHGTVSGPVGTADRNGAANGALQFDGSDDFIDLGERFHDLTVPFTVAAWVQASAGGLGEFRSIFATDDEPGRYAGAWFMISPTGQLSMSYASGGSTTSANRRTVESLAPIPTDRWLHVAATVRGPEDMTLYVNGNPISSAYSGTGGALLHTNNSPARIGAFRLIAANRPWLGGIDDVRLYDCSLGAGEVAFLTTLP